MTNCLRRALAASADCAKGQLHTQMRAADDEETVYVSGFVAVASLAEVPPGSKKLIEVNGVEVLLCNSVDRIFAVENLCSHAEEKLDCGRMRAGWIACPIHGARFDLATGEAMNPPATQPIQTWPVRISGDVIEIAL